MGTWTAFYVKSDRESVVAACKDWLSAALRSDVCESRGPFPDRIKFHLKGKGPRRLVVSQVSPAWCEVHYDGFYTPNPAAAELSARLRTTVVDTVAQTTSDAYEVTVYELGTQKRRLEFADYEWIAQEGQPLPNEPDPLAAPDEDNEDLSAFHYEEVARYCDRVFGFEFWRDPAKDDDWVDLNGSRRGILGWLRK